jgi:hypothetical protein
MANSKALERFHAGTVIPAHPLALTAERKLDERRQRALTRYYLDAGAGGLAVGVHTTQFAIRDNGMFRPVLELAKEELGAREDVIAIAGICGPTAQATGEAALARGLGYDAGLLSLAALKTAGTDELITHVAAVVPMVGFYLQPAVGGRVLPYEFWRQFAELENIVAIKMAPFNRYQTLDVVRAAAESGRADDIALYTGNDDNILGDLMTEFVFGETKVHIRGGLLGHWACWTQRSAVLLERVKSARGARSWGASWMTLNAQVTDANAAFFDAANGFHGCIAGIHEVLRRQGLLGGRWCLDENEELSPGQMEEIDRVYAAYPHLNDDDFVHAHRDEWLR